MEPVSDAPETDSDLEIQLIDEAKAKIATATCQAELDILRLAISTTRNSKATMLRPTRKRSRPEDNVTFNNPNVREGEYNYNDPQNRDEDPWNTPWPEPVLAPKDDIQWAVDYARNHLGKMRKLVKADAKWRENARHHYRDETVNYILWGPDI